MSHVDHKPATRPNQYQSITAVHGIHHSPFISKSKTHYIFFLFLSHFISSCFHFSKNQSTALKISSSAISSPLQTLQLEIKPIFSTPSRVSVYPKKRNVVISAAAKEFNNRVITGVVFDPSEEVKKELVLVPNVPQQSLARQRFLDDSESAINYQINVEYNASYVYHAMYAYFDRDNVALKGLAKFFKESSEEERQHAEKLMEYQNKRGGKVKLQSIVAPVSEFDHSEKGDALYAMELALSLEKLVNEKLLHLHSVANQNNDVQLMDFVETEYLTEQVDAIKQISEYVAQLRRVGKGHGVWHFDQMLLEGAAA